MRIFRWDQDYLPLPGIDLEDTIRFISSGTRAGPEHDAHLPYDKVASIFRSASSHGLMKPASLDKDKYEHDPDYHAAMQERAHMAFRILRPIEAALRNSSLYDVGLTCDEARVQTTARGDVSLVLGMEQKHVDQVNEIYSSGAKRPLITMVTEYAGVAGEIPDAIGNTDPHVYAAIRGRLIDLMPKVIDRYAKEFINRKARTSYYNVDFYGKCPLRSDLPPHFFPD